MKLNLQLSAITFMLFISLPAMGQEVKVVKFPEVYQLLHRNSDTLFIINFWATWCKPCVAELPHFQKLDSTYKNKNVKIVLISIDAKNTLKTQLIPFLKDRNIRSVVWLLDAPNANEWIDKVSPSWEGSIPATVINYRRGKFWQFYEKSFSYEELDSIVKPLIHH